MDNTYRKNVRQLADDVIVFNTIYRQHYHRIHASELRAITTTNEDNFIIDRSKMPKLEYIFIGHGRHYIYDIRKIKSGLIHTTDLPKMPTEVSVSEIVNDMRCITEKFPDDSPEESWSKLKASYARNFAFPIQTYRDRFWFDHLTFDNAVCLYLLKNPNTMCKYAFIEHRHPNLGKYARIVFPNAEYIHSYYILHSVLYPHHYKEQDTVQHYHPNVHTFIIPYGGINKNHKSIFKGLKKIYPNLKYVIETIRRYIYNDEKTVSIHDKIDNQIRAFKHCIEQFEY